MAGVIVVLILGVFVAVAFAGRVRQGTLGAEAPSGAPAKTANQSAAEAFVEGDDPAATAEWFNENRAGSEAAIPVDRYLRARVQVNQMARNQARAADTEQGRILAGVGATARTWTWLGPGNVGGRTRAMVIDPTHTGTMYAAGITGGVWKTADGGRSWNPLTDSLSNVAVGALALDPSNPAVIYAGTGEGYYAVNQWYRGAGILRSTDAGASWDFLPGTQNADFYYVDDIKVSARDPRRIYAATASGVWVSTDAGATWSRTLAATARIGCTSLALRTDKTPDVVFAGCGGRSEGQGIFRSVDGGLTWEYVVAKIDGQPTGVATLAIAPSNQDVVYASISKLMDEHGEEPALALIRSTTGGGPGSWTIQAEPGGPGKTPEWFGHCEHPGKNAQGGYDNALAVDPTDPERIWVGGIDLYRSDDGGRSLRIASYWYLGYHLDHLDGTQYAHADQHVILFDPKYDGQSNRRVYFGNDGGIFVTDNARAAMPQASCPKEGEKLRLSDLNSVTFSSLDAGYGVTQFYSGAVADDGSLIAGGAQDNGGYVVDPKSGVPNGWRSAWGGDVIHVAYDSAGDILYVQNPGLDFSKSTKPGHGPDTFDAAGRGITEDGAFTAPFVLDQSNPDVLWAAGHQVWRTTNAASSWQSASDGLSDSNATALAVSASNDNVMYVGFKSGQVFRSTNALSASPTWTNVSGSLPRARIGSISIDPADPKTVYIGIQRFDVGHVWKSSDGGGTWTNIDGSLPNVPVDSIAVNPQNRAMVYAGTDSGVFESLDGGATWRVANENLATTIVQDLQFRKGTSELYAFTFGRGVYVVEVGSKAPPVNDSIGNATSVGPGTFTDRVNTRLATTAGDDPAVSCGAPGDPRETRSVWYRVDSTTAGALSIDTSGSNYDTVVAVFTGSPGSLREVGCNDDAAAPGGPSKLSIPTTAGTTYLVEVTRSSDSTNELAGSLVFSVTR